MKHLVSLFTLILLCLSIFSSALASDTAIVTKPAGTKGDTVRLRQKPNGTILINVPFGKEVKVLDEQGEWMKISYNGRTGWMKSKFLSLDNSDDGSLSFDVTGDWYEWYTVDDLLAYQDISSYEKRRDIDYLLSEKLLLPSDGRICSIQLNSHGQYIYDNWTDYEVFISGNDELCIYDGYDEDSVQIASLSFVDKDTMWYWGSNEYVAVYKRTKPDNTVNASSTIYDDDSKLIKRVLDRKIFEFKEVFPELYSIEGASVISTIAYANDWTFDRILNEDVFETLRWEISEIDDKIKRVIFFGDLRISERIDKIAIEFYFQEGATVPFAGAIAIKNNKDTNRKSMADFIDDGMEASFSLIATDACVSVMLTFCYMASDVYLETQTELENEPLSDDNIEVINTVLNRRIFEITHDNWPVSETYTGTGLKDIRKTVAYTEDWTFSRVLNEENFEKVNWMVSEIGDDAIVYFTGVKRSEDGSILMNIEIEFALLKNINVPLVWSINFVNEAGNDGISVKDLLNSGEGIDDDSLPFEIVNASSKVEGALAQALTQLLPDIYAFSEIYAENGARLAYESIIDLYKSALRDNNFWEHYSENELNVSGIHDWVYMDGGTLLYTVYDVNQDGFYELLVAGKSGEYFSLIDIYTTNGTKAIRLFGERSFGYRDNIDVLSNGYLYTHGSSGANNIAFEVYSFNSNGHLEEIQAVDYSGDNMTAMEELRKPYKNMVIDTEMAYSWTALQ